ncbi:MAG: hypothetical protein FWF15_06145 [Oscillospiraceae bacterium]|nr:hypothetical protein [Oscillospiraceae bacterium]
MKRSLLIFIILIMIGSLFACAAAEEAGSIANKNSDEVLTDEPENLDSLAARQLVKDGLPDKDFGGDRFAIVTQTRMLDDVYIETEMGDVILDAVYARNRAVEERFNVVISAIDGIYTENNAFVSKNVLAGDDAFDLMLGQAVATSELVMKDMMLDWYLLPYVNFAQPWWARSTVDDLTYCGKAYIAIGDFSLSAMYATYCVYYDKVVAENYGITDVYEIVNAGKWTIDKLSELTKDVYQDLNGDGVKDIKDYYGFSTDPSSNLNAYLWAFDNPVMRKDGDGIPTLVIKTDKIESIVEKIRAICYQNQGSFVDNNYKGEWNNYQGLSRDLFRDETVMFANGYLMMSVADFRNVTNEYGIIPYPKWDEAQERYLTMSDGFHGILAVPKTVSDSEKIGVVTEALCAESWKGVMPKYYDVALKVKGARDEESIAMIDMIMEGRVFDFGYIYDCWKGMSFAFERILRDGKTGFETYYASNEQAVLKHYNSVLEYFEGVE